MLRRPLLTVFHQCAPHHERRWREIEPTYDVLSTQVVVFINVPDS